MLAIIRIVLIMLCAVVICVVGSLWCLLTLRSPRNTAIMGHLFGKLSRLCGLRVILRHAHHSQVAGNAIYVANHQNNYDLIVASGMAQPYTVTVGKRSLLWLPLFGLLYWLSGNLLIKRGHGASALHTIKLIVSQLQTRRISFWLFPEGTRSRGRGILPFKTGAFRAAMSANVPVVPVVVSNLHNKVKLNRWHNGIVIIEMLPPLDVNLFQHRPAREFANYCRDVVVERFHQLNSEVAALETSRKR